MIFFLGFLFPDLVFLFHCSDLIHNHNLNIPDFNLVLIQGLHISYTYICTLDMINIDRQLILSFWSHKIHKKMI